MQMIMEDTGIWQKNAKMFAMRNQMFATVWEYKIDANEYREKEWFTKQTEHFDSRKIDRINVGGFFFR